MALGIFGALVLALLPEAFGAGGSRFNACVRTNGSVRVTNVDGSVYCDPPGEWEAVWYTYPDSGRQGARGPAGPRGPRGQPGPRGQRGERGVRGVDGPDGKDGVDGVDGRDGPMGPRGPVGAVGGIATYVVSTPCEVCGDDDDAVRSSTMASCDRGDVALSGGFLADGFVTASLAIGDDVPSGWAAPTVTDSDGSSGGSMAVVLCLDTPPLRR